MNEKYTGNLFKTEVPWGEMSDTLNVLTYEDGNIKYNYDDLLYVLDKIVPSTEILEYEDDSVIMLLKCDSNSNSDYRYANILSLINGLETIYEAPYANSFSGLTNGYRVYNYRGDTPEDKFIFSKKGKISDKQGILYYVKKLSPEEKAKIVDSAKAIVASSNKKLESLKQVFGTDTEFYGVNDYEKKINELNKLVTDNAKATLIQAGTEALKVYDVASLEKKADEYKLLLKSRTSADTLLKSSLTKINSYKESSIDYENYKPLLSEYETLYNDLLKVKDSRQKEEIDESTKKLSAFDATKIDAAKKEYEVLLNARKDAQKILEDTTAKVSTYKDDKYLAYDKYLLFLNECNTFASDLETAIKGFEVEKINNAKDKCAKIDYSNFDKLKEEYELILRNQKIQEGQDACKKFGFEVALSEEKYDEKTLFIITAVTKKGLADKGGMKVNDYYNTQSNAQSLEDFYIEFASLSSTKSFVIPVVEKTKKGDFKVKQVKIKQK